MAATKEFLPFIVKDDAGNCAGLAGPVLNLNGDNADTLLKGYLKALEAINAATKLVQATAPHGRNFQTCAEPDAIYRKAYNEHVRRLERLNAIAEELNFLGQHVHDQKLAREKK